MKIKTLLKLADKNDGLLVLYVKQWVNTRPQVAGTAIRKDPVSQAIDWDQSLKLPSVFAALFGAVALLILVLFWHNNFRSLENVVLDWTVGILFLVSCGASIILFVVWLRRFLNKPREVVAFCRAMNKLAVCLQCQVSKSKEYKKGTRVAPQFLAPRLAWAPENARVFALSSLESLGFKISELESSKNQISWRTQEVLNQIESTKVVFRDEHYTFRRLLPNISSDWTQFFKKP